MKFVCDSCNAKYQIGDDKVAGKTLRMKCRRCGHMIQVAATVTESSVSGKPPAPPPAPIGAPSVSSEPSNEDGATVVKPSPLFLLEQSGLGAKSAGSSPPPGGPAIPRPGPSVAGSSPPFRGAPRIVPPARPSLRSVPPAAASNPNVALPPGTHSSSAPGLYGGFAQAVTAPPKPEGPALPTEDWYVGVNGVPLGPVRLAVLRDKAAQGQVDGSSLVWREGFDEWAPAKNFPGLLAIIEEAKQVRASRTNLPAVGLPPPAAPRVSLPSPQRPSAAGLAAAAPTPEPSVPFDLTRPSSPDRASISDHETSRASSAALAVPVAAASNGHAATGATTGGGVVVGTGFDPFAPAAAGVTASPSVPPPAPWGGDRQPSQVFGLTTTTGSTSEAPFEKPPKRGVHPAVWAFVAMAAAFGGVAAWALFLRKPDVVYLPGETTTAGVPTPTGANVPTPPTGTATGETPEAQPTVTMDASGKPVVTYGTGPKPTASAGKTGEAVAPIDPSTLGPNVGPTSTGTSDNATPGPLTSGQISGVVSSNTARVRKKCWDPLSTGRSADAPSSVKVNVEISIAPNGSVSSAKASGGNEKYYPGLAGCVQGVVSAWKFPTATEPTTVRVPISFSAQ